MPNPTLPSLTMPGEYEHEFEPCHAMPNRALRGPTMCRRAWPSEHDYPPILTPKKAKMIAIMTIAISTHPIR